MSVLEDLYSGKIYPLENIVSHNPAYRHTNEKIGDMRNYFSEKLLPEDREKFKEWNQLIHEANYMDAYANFAYGFRLAFMLFLDLLTENPKTDE
ncbi:MAG: hypothetical protein SOR79_10845 [Blautia sp.]|uniref:DUF6809 family protein n=1 Tax=Blautia sp. TaxID=1955243 RepID=UPI002A75FE55|nr:DUF6809 family protein [Blautia sp.]MDY3017627.1 hypothetical protein [Blautia sp.]